MEVSREWSRIYAIRTRRCTWATAWTFCANCRTVRPHVLHIASVLLRTAFEITAPGRGRVAMRCDHKRASQALRRSTLTARATRTPSNAGWDHRNEDAFGDTCGKCGATRIDRQIGLEASPDEWVARLVEVFREVRRVLRDDGTLWVEIGDSYAGGGGGNYGSGRARFKTTASTSRTSETVRRGSRTRESRRKTCSGNRGTLAFAYAQTGGTCAQRSSGTAPTPCPSPSPTGLQRRTRRCSC